MLVCSHVAMSYGKTKVLTDVSFELKPGDALCIAGPSGSGKSTLLTLLLRAHDPLSGSIAVDGAPLSALPAPVLQLYRSRVGVLFQEPMLLSHATLAENIAYPLELKGTKPKILRKLVSDMLERLGLLQLSHRMPHHLSNGERAMAQLGRALIAQPIIVLADEPFTHLDDAQSKITTEMLTEIQAAGSSLLILTRAPEISKHLGARMLTLEDGATHETKHTRAPAKPAKPHHLLDNAEAALPPETEAEPVSASPEPVAEEKPTEAPVEEEAVHHRSKRGGPRHRGEDGKVKITAING